MQFLLTAVNAKYIHSNPAIYSLRAYAGEEFRPFIGLAEYTINQRMEEILGDLYRRQPDVIGFSCYIWNISLIKELLRELPKVLPGTDLWLGGPEVSFEAEKLLREFPELRGIMVGEGEETFRELLAFYVNKRKLREEKQELEKIPGLVLQSGPTAIRDLTDMDKLPFLYLSGEHCQNGKNDFVPEGLAGFENRIIYYETSRGCPFRCGYCLSSIDKRVRFRNLETVKKELQFFLDQNVPQVKLIDRTFNCNQSHAMEIWQYLKEHDNGITNFHFEIAADIMKDEEVRLLQTMRPGLVQLEIGVQTTNGAVLKEINRAEMNQALDEAEGVPESIAKIKRVVRALHESRNIHIHLDLIAGLPLEDYQSFQNSFNQVYTMKPHQLQLGFLKVLKGTAIWEKAESYGLAYQDRAPYEVLYTRWISYEEILKLKQVEEMVELYYNSGQFAHTLPVLEREFSTPFLFYEALAAFYEQKGYFVRTPARSRRYQVLLEFAMEMAAEKEELWRELLTFDLYLREKAKSRPSFGKDLSSYREQIWEIYQEEEKEPRLLKHYSSYHARQVMNMTHMEVFFYPVWEAGGEAAAKRGEEPLFVLFDYEKKDPLTGNAAEYVVRSGKN